MQSQQNSKTTKFNAASTTSLHNNIEQSPAINANFTSLLLQESPTWKDVLSKHSIHSEVPQPIDQLLGARSIASKQSHHTVFSQVVATVTKSNYISSQQKSKNILNEDTFVPQPWSVMKAQVMDNLLSMSNSNNAVVVDQALLQDANLAQLQGSFSKQLNSKQSPAF